MIDISPEVEALTERIYEATTGLLDWRIFLKDLASATDCSGALMVSYRDGFLYWVASPEIERDAAIWIELIQKRCPDGVSTLFSRLEPRFAVLERPETDELGSSETLPTGPFASIGGALIPAGTDDIAILLTRSDESGPLDRSTSLILERLQPHLARAARLSGPVAAKSAVPVLEALTSLGLPAALLDGRGRMMMHNALLEPLLGSVLRVDENRIAVVDRAVDPLLRRVFSDKAAESTAIRSIALPARQGEIPWVLHLIPMSRAAWTLHQTARRILVATGAANLAVPRRSVLAALFDLTPAEAKVAHLLAKSLTTDEIAASLKIGRETVRTHVKSVLEKARVRRHIDFVRKVSSIHSLPTLGVRTKL